MKALLFFVFVSCSIGNFVFQALHGHDWNAAFDRSWFQGVALASFGLASGLLNTWG